MTKFTVIYLDTAGEERSADIEFDSTGYSEEDFMGGAGQEAIEDLFLTQYPDCEMQWLEWTDLEEAA